MIDPVSFVSASLSALNTYKEFLAAAKLTQAKCSLKLRRVVDTFETTILMIPSRGSQKPTDATKAASNEIEQEAIPRKTFLFTSRRRERIDMSKWSNALNELKLAKEFVFGAVFENSPLGIIDVLSNNKEIKLPEMNPGKVLANMRAKNCKDIEITFVGMAFIVSQALSIVHDAVLLVPQVEQMDGSWFCQPWKAKAQIELGDKMDDKISELEKFNFQLQSAVAVAAYAVSLEQLENVLNASNMLECPSIREFWRRKVGIDKTKVLMSELAECFLSEVSSQLQEAKKKSRHQAEQVIQQRSNPEVCLTRFLSEIWNINGDEYVSVYEVNNSTKIYEKLEREGAVGVAVNSVFKEILSLEKKFYERIFFYPLKLEGDDDEDQTESNLKLVKAKPIIDEGADGIKGTADDVSIFEFDPFDRLLVFCSLPIFDQEIYQADSVCLLKYESVRDPTSRRSVSDPLNLQEVNSTRAYVTKATSRAIYGSDIYRWNFVIDSSKEKKKNSVFIGKTQMDTNITQSELKVVVTSAEDEEEAEKTADLTKVKVRQTQTMVYAPILFEPGYYSVRYCIDDLNDLSGQTDTQSQITFKKKAALTAKSYYFDRTTGAPNIQPRMIATAEGVGVRNFLRYAQIKLGLIQIDIAAAMKKRKSTASEVENIKHLLLLKYNVLRQIELSKDAVKNPIDRQSFTIDAPYNPPQEEEETKIDGSENPLHRVFYERSQHPVPKTVFDLSKCDPIAEQLLDFVPFNTNVDVDRAVEAYRQSLSKLSEQGKESLQEEFLKLRASIALFKLYDTISGTSLMNFSNDLKKLSATVFKKALVPREVIEDSELQKGKSAEEANLDEAMKKLDICYTEQDNLWALASCLLPKEIASAVHSAKLNLLQSRQKYFYLYDPKRDVSEAVKVLEKEPNLLQNYVNIKIALLDADIESAEVNRSVKRRKKLIELKRILFVNIASKKLQLQTIRREIIPFEIKRFLTDLTTWAENRLQGEVKLRREKMDATEITKRRKSVIAATANDDVETTETDGDPRVRVIESSIFLCKKEFQNLESLDRIKTEIEFATQAFSQEAKLMESRYKDPNIAYLSQEISKIKNLHTSFHASSEESILHTSSPAEPSLGAVILVRDVPALVWGHPYDLPKDPGLFPYEDNLDEESVSEDPPAIHQNSSELTINSLENFRPAVERIFPFTSQRVIYKNPKTLLADQEEGFEPNRFENFKKGYSLAVFYHIPSESSNYPTTAADKKDAGRSKPKPPSELGIFEFDGQEERFIGFISCQNDAKIKTYTVDGKPVYYVVIDFGRLLSETLHKRPPETAPVKYKYIVKFLQPRSQQNRRLSQSGKAVEVLRNGPKLVLHFDEEIDEHHHHDLETDSDHGEKASVDSDTFARRREDDDEYDD